jgi:hypothetical protein
LPKFRIPVSVTEASTVQSPNPFDAQHPSSNPQENLQMQPDQIRNRHGINFMARGVGKLLETGSGIERFQ